MVEPEKVHATPAEPEQLSEEQLEEVSGGASVATAAGMALGLTPAAAGMLASGEPVDIFRRNTEPGAVTERLVAGGG